MYSGVSEGLNYLNRVASHSTKESATGRIRAVPTWAQPPIDYFEAQAREQAKSELLKEQERIFTRQKLIREQREIKLKWWKEVEGTTYGKSVRKSAERKADMKIDHGIRTGVWTIPQAQQLRPQLIETEIEFILKVA